MKAAVVREYGGPEVMGYADVPDPTPGPGEVLVKVAAASINPVDGFERGGALQAWRPLTFPAVIGWDVSGTVVQLGAGVSSLAVGDRVCAWAYKTFAELCAAKAELFAKVPDGLDLIEAAALPLVATTGNQLIAKAAAARSGDVVLVTGAVGNVGRCAVYTAKTAGATVIAGVQRRQIQQAGSIGADDVVALDDDAALAALDRVDVVANTVRGKTAADVLAKVKPWGTYASATGLPDNVNDYSNVRLISFVSSPDSRVVAELAAAVAAGRLTIPIGQRYRLQDAGAAMTAMESHAPGKILLVPNAA